MPRAMHLLMAEKAEVIETDGTRIHSPNASFAAPVVIRLRYYVRVPHNLPMPLSRRAILLRDVFTCQYCGMRSGAEGLTFDHVIPKSRGGRTTWPNVVAACEPCNLRKGGMMPVEAQMFPRSRPRQPTTHELQQNGRSYPPNYLHESWRDFLYWDSELEPV